MPEWRVPGYTELKGLGSGGFGRVVLARHDGSGTLVAIKYLHRDLVADAQFAEMFRGEAAVLAALDDPNIVRVHEYVEALTGAAIVMELISGISLREILTYRGKTSAEAALTVLHGSLAGLAAAHRRGVVHRDYKPENILVNGDGVSKLTDFGIAARAGSHPVPAGTLAYAAPEQMAGDLASPASDIYAATVTFYECLTGRPPFTGAPDDLLRQHRTGPVPLDPVPEPLRPLVAAGMAKDPRERPTDAASFVTELGAAAAAEYGRDWHDRGRSHLAEATLLLAALWPAGSPPAVQGTIVQHVPLRQRTRLPHTSAAKALITAGAAIAVVAGAAALASAVTHGRGGANHPVAAVQPVSLHPGLTQVSRSQLPPPARTSPSQLPPPTQSPPSSPSPSTPGSPSRSSTARTPGAVPAAPSNLTVTAIDQHDIRLTWQEDSSAAAGFEISNGVVTRNAGPGSTSYTWGGLTPGTYMCFKILAYGNAGDSAWAPTVSPWYQCTTTPKPQGTASTVAVSSTTGWQETPVSLQPGEQLTIAYVSGTWSVDYRNFPFVGPGGYSEAEDAKIYQGCKVDTSETYGVLLGSIGSEPQGDFPLGQGGTFSAASSGRLYLRINDTCLTDNSGSVTMTIKAGQ